MIFKINLYNQYLSNLQNYLKIKQIKKKKKIQLKFFSIFMHKKLMYFRFLTLKNMYTYSVGQLFKKKIQKVKSFKKSIQNHNYTINCLNRKFRKPIYSIYLFFCKNFNLKNYLWIKKFFSVNKPHVEYMLITHSWNYITKKKKRIKRKIFKRLLKSM